MKHSKKPVFKPLSAYDSRQLTICRAIIDEQRRVVAMVKSVLPPEIATHVSHGVVSSSRLLLYTESASWASQIRFFNEAILNKLQSSGQINIKKLQLRVIPALEAASPVKRKPYLPSADTVGAIAAQVDEASGDELDKALSRLGKTLARRLRSQPAD